MHQFFLAIIVTIIPLAAWAEKQPPDVNPGTPTLLGVSGLSVNFQVHSHGVPTTWQIKYGKSSDLDRKTEAKPVPPKLAAYYRESWDEGWNGWNSWCPKRLHFKDGGVNGAGYISYEGSPRDDHNHDDGVGTVHLTPYMYPGSVSMSANAPSAYLGGGDPDFRDAIIRQSVRGRNWKPNGTELMWWSQAQSNIEINPDDQTLAAGYKHPNWSYTGKQLTDLLASGKWETAEYKLLNDTNQWSYCGNNKGEKRYEAYWSIDETQRHLNLDLFHMIMFVDTKNWPTGAIDFDEFAVAYHNYSLVYPTNGGKLISAPKDGADAQNLTDGWRHGFGKMWHSTENLTSPQEFVYEFATPVTIDKVQLHQHPEWPAKEVEVLTSEDGKNWQPLVKGELAAAHPHGANYNFLLKKKLSAKAKFAKVRILSGHKPEHWGLGEIEIFGDGAIYTPDNDWFHVNADLVDFEPGETVYYRIVATNEHGSITSPIEQFTLPKDATPHVITGEASRIGQGTAKVEGRLNPLGKKTEFYFEYGPTDKYGQKTTPRYGGLQITPRLGFDTITSLETGKTYHYRLVAVNEAGAGYGADATFVAR